MSIHRRVRQLVADEKSKIKDKEFFTSMVLRRHFEDIAYGITQKFGRNRVSVYLQWNEDPKAELAYTDGLKVTVNTGSTFYKDANRSERYIITYGLNCHELGHILYTDFTIIKKMKEAILNYQNFYPEFPKDSKFDVAISEIKEYLKDANKASIIIYLIRQLHNIVEDGHIENRMMYRYTGDVKRSLEAMRKIHFADIPEVPECIMQEEREEDILTSILQQLLSYALYGEIKVGSAKLSDERIQAVFSVMDEVDEYIVSQNAYRRAELGNLIFIKLWAYYKAIIDLLCEEQEQNRQFPQLQGASAQGSGGIPMVLNESSSLGDNRDKSQTQQARKQSQSSKSSSEDDEDEGEEGEGSSQSSKQSKSQKSQQNGKGQSGDDEENEQGEDTQSGSSTGSQTGSDEKDGDESGEDSANGSGSKEDADEESDDEIDNTGSGNNSDGDNSENGDDKGESDETNSDNDSDDEGEETENSGNFSNNEESDEGESENESGDNSDTDISDESGDESSNNTDGDDDNAEGDDADENQSNEDENETDTDESEGSSSDEDEEDFDEDEEDDTDEENSSTDNTESSNSTDNNHSNADNGEASSDAEELGGEYNRPDFGEGCADEIDGDGSFEHDTDYEGDADINADKTIDDLLEEIAEEKANNSIEKSIKAEAEEIASSINYGNIHKNCSIILHRQLNISESLIETYQKIAPELLAIAKGLAKTVMQKLKDYQQGGKFTNLYFGRRIDKNNLAHTDGKIFYNNRLPQDLPQLSVGVLADESGSMNLGNRSIYARAAALILYDFCQQLNIPITIVGHSAEDFVGVRTTKMHFFDYCEFDSVDGADKYRLMDIKARGCTRDGAALRYINERLVRRPEEQKILFVISDGEPFSTNYTGEKAKEDIRSIVKEYEKKGIKTIALAIGDDKDEILSIYGENRFLDITDLKELPRTMTKKIITALKIS